MPAQTALVNEEAPLHLQVDVDQATSPKGLTSRHSRLLWTGCGFVGLVMLIGIFALASRSLTSPSDSLSRSTKPSQNVPTFAFSPALPVFGPAGLHPARLSAKVRTSSKGLRASLAENDPTTVSRISHDLEKLEIPQLKAELKQKALSTSGKKGDMVARLAKKMDEIGDTSMMSDIQVGAKVRVVLPVSDKFQEIGTVSHINEDSTVAVHFDKDKSNLHSFHPDEFKIEGVPDHGQRPRSGQRPTKNGGRQR